MQGHSVTRAGAGASASAVFYRAAHDTGLLVTGCPVEPVESLLRARYAEAIAEAHRRGRAAGIPYPEVDIERIWATVFRANALDRYIAHRPDRDTIRELAVRFECLTNPVWPMPDAADTLQRLARGGITLGILSNAQFYTPLVLEALFGASPADFGVEDSLCLWSYRIGRAKPDPAVFELLCARLARFARRQILYVGNDPVKDVAPAAAAGCRTCLLVAAGDSAGYAAGSREGIGDRGRPDMERSGVRPDRVISALPQVVQIAISRRTVCGNSSFSLSFC